MQALHHQVGTEPDRAFRLSRREPEVGAMRAVHNQNRPGPVRSLCNGLHIRHHSIIGGRGDHNRLDIRISGQSLFYLLRRYGIRHTALQQPGIQKNRIQLPQTDRVID